ncbi:hypothetical protein RUM44_007084 [Polyplax serrata]|uniref:Uncharacterized protein n=1 Tax=Polyplax serrata TaxID=468196 RepID=A0ABR1B069_POLSC
MTLIFCVSFVCVSGVTFKAHKLILAACSKHFQDLFEGAPFSPSVLVILDGTSSSNMSALLEFMYKGEVHVSQEHLSSFLKAAECLQVKGLSIEHEKLAMVHTQHSSPTSHENPLDSPTGRSKPKLPFPSNGTCKEVTENGSSQEPLPSHSSPYSPAHSTYMHQHHYRPPYEQRVPASAPGPGYDCHRKRRHRSPSDHQDSVVRASVLREASSKSRSGDTSEKLSPMSLSYRPSPEPKHVPEDLKNYPMSSPQNLIRGYDVKSESRGDFAGTNTIAGGGAAAITFDRTAGVDIDNNHKRVTENRHTDPSCPEDLRVKMEPSNSCDEVHSNAVPYKEMSADKAPDIVQVGSMWDASSAVKPLSHKGSATPDGKKLKCPFCERLYGYETNLRAHIRQRHQGIRVPCPFCSRTFTRNNTVRRHIAREHKTELSLKAFRQNQVHNHAQ